MKGININGKIKIYNQLPKSWGKVIGGFDLLSDDDLKSYGFYDVVIPDYDSRIKTLSDIYFDTSNEVFTKDVIDIIFNETIEELKENAIKKLQSSTKQKLLSTDWYITRSFERNIAIPENIENQRNSILESHNQQEIQINSLSKKTDIITYEFK